jgi:DNA-binding transcriptional LysR family regulator
MILLIRAHLGAILFSPCALLRDDYVVVANRDSPIAKNKRPPSLAEIANQPLIGFRQCRATEIVVDQLRASGHEPRFVSRSDDNGVVQGLAGAGIGIAVMPRLTVDANDESIVIVDLGHRLAPRIVGMVWHADRYHSAAARSFVQTAQEVAAETGAALAA